MEASAFNLPVQDWGDHFVAISCGPEYPVPAGTMFKRRVDTTGGKVTVWTLTSHQAAVVLFVWFKGEEFPRNWRDKPLKDYPWAHAPDRDQAVLLAEELAIPGVQTFGLISESEENGTEGVLVGFAPGVIPLRLEVTPAGLRRSVVSAFDALSNPGAVFDVRHNATTTNGSCGQPLMVRNKPVAVHYATDKVDLEYPNIANWLLSGREIEILLSREPEARVASWKDPKPLRDAPPSKLVQSIPDGEYLGVVDRRVQARIVDPDEPGPHMIKPCVLYDKVTKTGLVSKAEEYEYAGTVGTDVAFARQIAKYGAGTNPQIEGDPLWERAFEYVEQMFEEAFTQMPMTNVEARDSMDLTKSPGFPYTAMGARDKATVLQWPEYRAYADTLPPCYFAQSQKHEWKLLFDIQQHKVRTFSSGPLHLVEAQVALFGRQGEALKMTGPHDMRYTAYGFNPYEGGVHSLAMELSRYGSKSIASRDVSGWDRMVCILGRIYDMRIRGVRRAYQRERLDIPKHVEEKMAWVQREISSPSYILPDGSVVRLRRSNPSGQGLTTDDNIVAHAVYEVRMQLEAYPELTYQECLLQVVRLYGDDHIGAYSPNLAKMYDPEWLVPTWKKITGMDLKFVVTGSLEKHTFLGFKFHVMQVSDTVHRWVPLYVTQRLVDAMRFNIKKMTPEQELQKMRSLTIMSFPNPGLFGYLSKVYRAALEVAPNTPAVERLRALGLPGHGELVGFYTGLESTSVGGFRIPLEVEATKKWLMNGKDKTLQVKRVKAQAAALRQAIGVAQSGSPQRGGAGRASGAPTPSVGVRGGGAGSAPPPRAQVVRVNPGLGSQPRQGVRAATAQARPKPAGRSLSISALPKVKVVPLEEGEHHPSVGEAMPVNAERLIRPEQVEKRAGSNGNVIYAGSEYMGAVVIPYNSAGGTLPSGSTLVHLPLNPFLWDGSRLQKESGQFELFKIHRMALEFKSSVSPASTTVQGQLQSYMSGDISDHTGLFTGDAGVRAGMARPGGCIFQVFQNSRAELAQMQQKWYYVSPDGIDPHLSYPGYYAIVLDTPFAIPTAADTILGTLVVHFEIEFESPAIADPSGFTLTSTAPVSIGFSGITETVGGDVAVLSTSCSTLNNSVFMDEGVIGWGIVTGITDATVPTTWRTWRSSDNGDAFVIGLGTLVFFRYSANGYFYFYPEHAAALSSGGLPSNNFSWTIASALGGTPTLVLGGVKGETLRKA